MPEEPPVASPPVEGGDIITSPPDINEEITTSPPTGDVVNTPPATPQPPPDQPTEPETNLPVIGLRKLKDINIQPNAAITVDKLSALQKAGFRLAVGVGTVITVVILVVLAQTVYLVFNPKTDSVFSSQDKFENVIKENANSLNSTNTDEKAKADKAIKEARANVDQSLLNDSTWNRITSLFDLVVVKALLPIFTTILGYIFGSRMGSDD